jgi:hypothetical protein
MVGPGDLDGRCTMTKAIPLSGSDVLSSCLENGHMQPVPCVGRFLDTVSQPADQVVDADTILGETVRT